MDIQTFVNGYNKLATESLKERYIKDNLAVKPYLNFAEKVSITSRIARVTTHEYDKDGTQGNVHVNSVSRYLLSTMNIIDAYTDLEVDFSKITEEYDALASCGAVQDIINAIPSIEVGDFQTVLAMQVDDIMQNELSAQGFISSQVTRFGSLLSATLEPIFNKIADELKDVDDSKIDKIAKALEKGIKRIK